jgi:hypothetical protein
LFGPADVTVRLPADESEPRDVHPNVAAPWVGRIVVKQPAARILETEFVDLGWADCPEILRRNSGVPESLLRRPRVRVLSEILRRSLRIHLDARRCARAGAATQGELVRIIEMVIQAQRINTRSFEYGEVALR